MFGGNSLDDVRLLSKNFLKPGVRLLRETVISTDPMAKRVLTDQGVHKADYLVVALGADYDFSATPGLAQSTGFYAFAGAVKLAGILPTFTKGSLIISVCAALFKCPPAPNAVVWFVGETLKNEKVAPVQSQPVGQ